MPTQIEQIRAAALANSTYNGTLNGLLRNFYNTTGDPDNLLLGLEDEWLKLMGYLPVDVNLKWQEYIADFGFTGALATGLQQEAELRHLFPQGSITIPFALLLEDGDFLLTEDGFHILNN